MTQQKWNDVLADQLEWHWKNQIRDRLAGLSDEEYFWEPVPGAWNVRRRGTSSAAIQGGSGSMIIEFAAPAPEPTPFTTIAWRLGHVIVGVLAMRNASHFGREPTDYLSFDYASSADQALAQLDEEYHRWITGVKTLGEAGLHQPCGEDGFDSMARLVLHIHRELIHHLAEVALLRDLFAHSGGGERAEPGRKMP
ncbi:DinB family protein [Nesterenkonia sp.]|uniref:DinB family protein n=1 Tax=Nesterenkonia sp. TaxID=704201 RepID=UPI002622E5B8|nr:DinB family protein [Nesterenkonia sp.]